MLNPGVVPSVVFAAAYGERRGRGAWAALRVVHRLLRVACTIVDLDGAPTTCLVHLREALGYRERPLEALAP